jgi:hypothetical protein
MKALDLAKLVGAVPSDGDASNFTTGLFTLLMKADPQNRSKMARAFPAEVKMVGRYQYGDGSIVDPEHPELGGWRRFGDKWCEERPWQEDGYNYLFHL